MRRDGAAGVRERVDDGVQKAVAVHSLHSRNVLEEQILRSESAHEAVQLIEKGCPVVAPTPIPVLLGERLTGRTGSEEQA